MPSPLVPLLIVIALGTSCATAQSTAESPEQPARVAVVVPVGPVAASAGSGAAAPSVEVHADTEDAGAEETERGIGNMNGDDIGDSFGAGGLGLSGTGTSGGSGIGIGNIGGLGHGAGTGSSSSGSVGSRSPSVPVGAPTAQGQLDREVIRRVVARNRPRITACYRQELAKDPNLEGRLAVRFQISRDGNVAFAAASNVEIPNANVVSCVVRAVLLMKFPRPSGGVVVVTFPFSFRRADVSAVADAGDTAP